MVSNTLQWRPDGSTTVEFIAEIPEIPTRFHALAAFSIPQPLSNARHRVPAIFIQILWQYHYHAWYYIEFLARRETSKTNRNDFFEVCRKMPYSPF